MEAPEARGERLPSLDGLRAVAILLVLADNLSVFGGDLQGPSRGVELAFDVGWAGVQLFFVLSGYLITRGLLRTRQRQDYFGSFYRRQALRIVPMYALTLIVVLTILPALGPIPSTLAEDRHHQLWSWLYLTNCDPYFAHGRSVMTNFWSLALEEQFYLVRPFVVRHTAPGQLLRT